MDEVKTDSSEVIARLTRERDELQHRLERWQRNQTQFATNQQVARLIAERDEALAEVERLKAEYNETLQMAATQAVTIKNQIGEIERLRQCCTQRGARMQIIWDWMGLVAVRNFLLERPEARDWFDEDGVPK